MLSLQQLKNLQHSRIIPQNEFDTLLQNLNQMKDSLMQAASQALEPPDGPHVSATYTVSTGRRGCPRIEIIPDLLQANLQYATKRHLNSMVAYSCSSRTIRRRAVEYGIEEPGEPVYVEVEDEHGQKYWIYAAKHPTDHLSDLTDEELDEIMLYIITAFPAFGRRMIDGHLKYLGHRVSWSRVEASYSRVIGAPRQGFGVRRIERRVYKVAGPNALWHHDGQHGKCTFLFNI
jgi:hypothetical protein